MLSSILKKVKENFTITYPTRHSRLYSKNSIDQYFLWTAALAAVAGIIFKLTGIDSPTGIWVKIFSNGCTISSLMYVYIVLQSYHWYQREEEYLHATDTIDMEFTLKTMRRDKPAQEALITNGPALYQHAYQQVYKRGVSSFEKSFYTYHLVRRYEVLMNYKQLIFLAILLTCGLCGNLDHFAVLSMTFANFALFLHIKRLDTLTSRLGQINECYHRIFALHPPSTDMLQYLEQNILEYEKVLSWASIHIPTRIADKLIPSLMVKWAETKSCLNVQQ